MWTRSASVIIKKLESLLRGANSWTWISLYVTNPFILEMWISFSKTYQILFQMHRVRELGPMGSTFLLRRFCHNLPVRLGGGSNFPFEVRYFNWNYLRQRSKWFFPSFSMIPELSPCQNERTGLTAWRYGMTVASNIAIYLITWIFLGKVKMS